MCTENACFPSEGDPTQALDMVDKCSACSPTKAFLVLWCASFFEKHYEHLLNSNKFGFSDFSVFLWEALLSGMGYTSEF